MSAYEPPTAVYPIFDSLAFQTPNSASLTLAEGDLRYLARQNIATSNATLTSFAGDITIGNSILDYTAGTGLSINTTANGESIFANVLTAGGVSRLKLELNPGHIHLYDNIRITDSTFNTYTQVAQSSAVLTFNNTTSNNSAITFNTRTGGGVTVTPLSLSSIQCSFGLPLTLNYTATPAAGQLGFRTKTNANVATAVTNFTVITLITGGFTLNVGTYLITLNGHMTITAAAGTVTQYELGLSTANNSFTGGFVSNVLGSYNVPAVGSASVTGQTTQVFNVTPATAGTYFFNHRLTFATIVPTLSTGLTYIEYTRIA
jgi:hypothetical protein